MRFVRHFLAATLIVILLVGLTGYLLLRASLPQLDGDVSSRQLAADVVIERDELGVVTIRAETRTDAAFATGFVHAQERFFQMDLQRRAAAGELSALFGSAALKLDETNRVHRFRHRAQQSIADLPPADIALYKAYTAGVNTGLDSLGARPFEYFLLSQKPKPWRDEDILLTVYSMFFELNDEQASRESQLGMLRELLPAPVYNWLIQPGTEWDAPIHGDAIPAVPIPGPEYLDLRGLPLARSRPVQSRERASPVAGSNNWAVSGERSADGGAMLAGDMHLGHAVPNIWFRARLLVANEDLDITGITLPGAPLVVAGSNGRVAWAFTNSYGDWEDLAVLELDPSNPNRYKTPSGWREFAAVVEPIEVKGAATNQLTVRETHWGPVVGEDYQGRTRALRWLPHVAGAVNAGIASLEQAHDVDEAMAIANQAGIPPQNFVVAGVDGRIGWTIMGQIPQRSGYDPAIPVRLETGPDWQGWVPHASYPRIVDPPEGLLWTANARTVDGDWLKMLGEGNHPVGARAGQIRDGLRARDAMTIDDMLAIQLDDRALFLSRWRNLLLQLLTPQRLVDHPQRREFRDLAAQWGGRATIDSAGYRLVRAFRLDSIATISSAVLAGVPELPAGFSIDRHSQLERPVWQAITSQPAHLLPPAYSSWDDYLVAIVDATIDYYTRLDGSLADRTWGERNTTWIAHPLTRAVPLLSDWLNMPNLALPGDANMPRVQGPAFGASQRMAVSPGNEKAGYFHMPGGQSGHPMSPYYGAGHTDWARGIPTAFLPGDPQHRLMLLAER